jgi:hypothetical protein
MRLIQGTSAPNRSFVRAASLRVPLTTQHFQNQLRRSDQGRVHLTLDPNAVKFTNIRDLPKPPRQSGSSSSSSSSSSFLPDFVPQAGAALDSALPKLQIDTEVIKQRRVNL